ncbi:uncharacterized protein LOC9649462 isoform X1 [Selaginella moellendorffii]|uniref:uncharacterized protein LOC9649462 isoform X1 n=1 Tax=Selaginella moellendorffii TaxID=88036 RepID=UPI000D1CA59B|nr:uncharacterized protein LOC9649462 isoform X1 [Selaginella moellendorffii]XP_024514837.1 uncharacterized protein LOC9649462 isoform X1 [Selaginella moellendorffii]|eukprot:XP_024514836.1 uncharacterized protein LOC9649462 isoform X1 [Selaginella moellendorffii]
MSPSYGVGASRLPVLASAVPSLWMAAPISQRALRIGEKIRPGERIVMIFIRGSRRFQLAPAKPRKVEHEFYEDDDYDRDFSMDGDSMVLLVQLVRTILRKLSSRATKAARGMLPPIFTSDLISFFVNGAVLLTVFWVAKALLEVVCSMGSMMFIGLLLVRSVWSILSYLQSQRYSGSFRNGNDRSNSNRRNMRGGGGGGDDFDDHHYRVSPS